MNNVTTVKECVYCVNHHCAHPYYNDVTCESCTFCDLYKAKDNMETKEIKITPPEGYEIDKENSTLECIKFKKRKELNYEDVTNTLFYHKNYYYINSYGKIEESCGRNTDPNNGTSSKQLEKLFAINKLMNVAKYLNGDWKANFQGESYKYSLYVESNDNIKISWNTISNGEIVYFKSKELAQQAIDILGEDTIRLALSTDW